MYFMPQIYAVTDHMCAVENEQVQMCEEEILKKGTIPCDEMVFELCTIILDEMNWELPSNPEDMCEMYVALRREIHNNL